MDSVANEEQLLKLMKKCLVYTRVFKNRKLFLPNMLSENQLDKPNRR